MGETLADYAFYDITVAFLWHPSTNKMDNLGALGGEISAAHAINNHTQVVGSAETANYVPHAFIWDPVNLMRDISSSPWVESAAYAINDGGEVVGAFGSIGVSTSAFRWTVAGGMQDLNKLVVNLPQGVHMTQANGINKSGQIVGNTANGRAFLLTPRKSSAIIPILQGLLLSEN